MAGPLDGLLSPEVQALLAGGSGQQEGLLGAAGTWGTGYQRNPNEGLLTQFLGSNDPRDPRGQAMAALSQGLLRGNFADGLAGANKAFFDARDRAGKERTAQLGLLKTGLELDGILTTRKRDAAINSRLAKLGEDERTAQSRDNFSRQLDPQPVDSFGTPGFGGMPMFGMQGMGPSSSQPAATYQPPQPRGVMADAQPTQPASLMVGNQAGPFGGQQAPNATQAQYQRMLQQARIYEEGGRPDMAVKLLQAAQQFQPDFATEFRQVVDPVTKKLINVQVSKDGTIRPVPFGVKPDIQLENMGGRTLAIDKNATQGGQSWDRTMTPGEVASNRVAQGNLRVAQERLTLDRDAPQYITQDGVTFAVPKRPQPGAPIIGRPVVGMDGESLGGGPKLTEGQARAMTFAARMVDSNKVLEQLEGEASPSSIMRGAYKPNFPAWLPGGQLAAAGLEATNRFTTPQAAQQLYQAQTNWVTANLRKESGAVIGPEEMQTEIRKWFGQPGEPQAVLDQKRAARRVAQESMVAEAGPGSKQIPGILGRAAASEKSGQGQGSSGKAMSSLPAANPANKGRKIRDNQTGRLLQSDGFQWKEVR
jgi:hypothetical protein